MMSEDRVTSIEFKEMSFAYEGEEALLNTVTMLIEQPGIYAVRGPAGCGKSSFLKIISGILQSTSGDFLINNHNVNDMSFEQFLPFRLNMGYSFDFGGLLTNKTLRENLELPLRYHDICEVEQAQKLVSEIIEEFGLQDGADKRPASVSGGARKATCVARAFLLNPDFLLFDDPTTGLAPEVKKNLKNKILKLREKDQVNFVFITSEDEKFMSGLAKKEIIINRSGIEVKDLDTWNRAGVA